MSDSKEFSIVKILEQHLVFGDKSKIAKNAGVTEPTVTRFFRGTKGKNYKRILTEVLKVAKENKRTEKLAEEHAAA